MHKQTNENNSLLKRKWAYLGPISFLKAKSSHDIAILSPYLHLKSGKVHTNVIKITFVWNVKYQHVCHDTFSSLIYSDDHLSAAKDRHVHVGT
jgi:hypothetical protein